jgi:cell division protein FtsQ
MVNYVKEKDFILRFFDEKEKKFFTLTKNGEIVEFYSKSLKLPLIIGPFDPDEVVKFFNKLSAREKIMNEVTDIIPFFGYRFDIVLNRKILVKLPETGLEEALSLLENFIEKNEVLSKNIKQIDFRIGGKVIIEHFMDSEPKVFKREQTVTTFTWN